MNTLALDLAQVLRGFFLLATIAALSVNAIPALRQGFLLYGSRQTDFAATSKVNDRSRVKQKALLDIAAQLQVPHSWFIHFYISSVASSIFWGYQIATNGAVLAYIISLSANSGFATSSMTFNQVVITWTFMTLQGCRRLLECLTLVKPSKAQMPILSWLLGIAFYISVGLSIWIEGIPILSATRPSITSLDFSKPSIKTWIAVPLFVYASGVQHDCHEHLASLRKYTLPDNQFFKRLLCPHYTAECIIYLAIAIVSAPSSQFLNTTMTTAFVFTFANLALTAESSREWYTVKFGADKIQNRWRMIPYVF